MAAPAGTQLSVLSQSMSSAALKYQLRVRFYRRMRHQRVYPLTVELRTVGAKATTMQAEPLVVRPIVPGAFVSPAEQQISAKSSNNQVTFYVTTLALGKLKEARLQAYYLGGLLQEIRLPMRSTRQRMTWFLAALTILVPAGILYLTSLDHLARPTGALEPGSGKAVPQAKGGKPMLAPDPKKAPDEEEGQEPSSAEKKVEDKKAEANGGDDKAKEEPKKTPKQGPLGEKVMNLIPDEVPIYKTDDYNIRIDLSTVGPEAADGIQVGFDAAHQWRYGSFYVAMMFLGFTGISYVLHRPCRGKRKGSPIVLPMTPSALTADPLSFAGPR